MIVFSYWFIIICLCIMGTLAYDVIITEKTTTNFKLVLSSEGQLGIRKLQ